MARKTDAMERPHDVGVINPYALVEALGEAAPGWQEEGDTRQALSDVLGMPYEQLFDPKFDSPLYLGLHLNPATLEMEQEELPEPEVGATGIDEMRGQTDADEFLSDADKPLEGRGVADVLAGLAASAVWQDKGAFLHEAVEFFDPVQGAVGDCYLIAALSSVAWARTYDIAHRSRATGTADPQFVDMVTFFDGKTPVRVEVTEAVPVSATGSHLYARSWESGEIWPAVYEKAYAKWRTSDPGDAPDILRIAGGDPVGAAAQLTGLAPSYHGTAGSTADAIFHRVRENSLSCKTFNPMVAWTYPSGEASPDKVTYGDANLVANHAYSILGWDYRNGIGYLVLRNPWGQTEASKDLLTGSWSAWDAPYYGGPGWWRSISLAANDGIFGLRVDTFKKYFAGLGVVK